MTRVAIRSGVTPSDFLEWERAQPLRHEYWNGEIFDMAGGSPRHAALASRVAQALGSSLGRKGCEIFSSDLQLGLPGNRYVYGDVAVVCGEVRLQRGSDSVVENPTMVIEVLSKNTEEYDRGLKWDGYRRIASLSDYVLVSQTDVRVEHFSRAGDGSWIYRVAEAGGRITFSNGAALDVDTLYGGIFDIPGD
jgi:Uma2 family endonuclease